MTSSKANNVFRKIDAESIALAKRLVRQATHATLATKEADSGHPMASRVTVATDFDGTPIILVSDLSSHTKALNNDAKCSLLVGEVGDGDPLSHPRMTIFCTAEKLDRASEIGKRTKKRFLARQPAATLYADFGDFHFFRLTVERANLNGGFAKAYLLDAKDFILNMQKLCDAFAEREDGVVSHMNADHQDSIARYAKNAAPALASQLNDADWTMTGIDPDGMDLSNAGVPLRIAFENAPISAEDIRSVLVAMA